MSATLAVLSALTCLPCAPVCQVGQHLHSAVATRKSEPQTWAVKALASGHLRPWERQWATRMAAGQVGTPRRVWLTQYGEWDPQHYHGALYHVAANRLPLGTVLWCERTRRLHVVTNRGAASNDRVAERRGAALWCDVWTHREGQYGWQTTTGTVWVIGRAPWPR